MFNLTDIFQLSVNSFNNCLFPQDNLVVNEHEGILHVIFQFVNQMNIVHKWFTPVIYNQMKLKAKEATNGRFSFGPLCL
jgi:hypothetical protein